MQISLPTGSYSFAYILLLKLNYVKKNKEKEFLGRKKLFKLLAILDNMLIALQIPNLLSVSDLFYLTSCSRFPGILIFNQHWKALCRSDVIYDRYSVIRVFLWSGCMQLMKGKVPKARVGFVLSLTYSRPRERKSRIPVLSVIRGFVDPAFWSSLRRV